MKPLPRIAIIVVGVVVLVPPTLISGLCSDNIRRRFRIRRRLSRDVGADLPRNNLCSRALGPRGPILDCPDRPGLRIFRDLSGYRDHHRGRDAFSIRDPFRDLRDPYGRRRRDASSNRDPSHDHRPSIGRDRSVDLAVAGNSGPAGQELFAAAQLVGPALGRMRGRGSMRRAAQWRKQQCA